MITLGKIFTIGLVSFLSSTQVAAGTTSLLAGSQIADVSVYAPVYLTLGAGSTIGGNLSAGDVTIGASSAVGGNIFATGATTVGASSLFTGGIITGAALTIGASTIANGDFKAGAAIGVGAASLVQGDVGAYAAITLGAASLVRSQTDLSASSVSHQVYEDQLTDSSTSLFNSLVLLKSQLTAAGTGTAIVTVLPPTITNDGILLPGIYSADSLAIAANTTLLLDAQGKSNQLFIFNIGPIFTVGALSNIILINAGSNDAIYWNVAGYTSIGAMTVITGTILATDYITLGEQSTAISANYGSGGIYSLTSYITTGANSYLGRPYNFAGGNSVPEPATWAMMIGGMGMAGAALRFRRRRLAIAA